MPCFDLKHAMESVRREKGGHPIVRLDEHLLLLGCAMYVAAHHVTGLFVNAGQIMSFTAMLLGIAEHLFRSGAARCPVAGFETNVRTFEGVAVTAFRLNGSASFRMLRVRLKFGHKIS
jgi:hypothetical protein